MRLMESPINSNPDDIYKGAVYKSTAHDYITFLAFSDKEVVRPENT